MMFVLNTPTVLKNLKRLGINADYFFTELALEREVEWILVHGE